MPTLRDVASLAGVSVATVSHVINETRTVSAGTRDRVRQAAARLGYRTGDEARSLAMSRNGSGEGANNGNTVPDPLSYASAEDHNRLSDEPAAPLPPVLANSVLVASPARSSRLLLRLLHAAQPISRVDLARRLGVNRSTVTDIFKPLIAAGVVVEEPLARTSSSGQLLGRPPLSLTFNLARRDLFVGVNLGVRRTQVGFATLGNEILAEEDFETPPDPHAALDLVRATIEKLLARVPEHNLRIIGVSVPGPVDAERSRLVYAPHLGWTDVAIKDVLRFESVSEDGPANLSIPVIVDNDSSAAALYEARLRLGQMSGERPNDFILVRSGTGIGVGLVLGGEVYRGTGAGRGLAGEFGHMTIVAGGKTCACGNRGCWEQYASASSASSLYMGDRHQLGGINPPRFVEIVERADAGEMRAQRTLERIGEYLGIGIGNVIMGLGVPRVIVSGRLVYAWRYIQEPLRKAIDQGMAGKLSGWSVEAGEPRGAALGGALEIAVDEFLISRLAPLVSSGVNR